MGRLRTIEARALNIRLNSKEKSYSDLIEFIYKKNFAYKVRSDTYVSISSLAVKKDENPKLYVGTLVKYTKIDIDADWYDEEDRQLKSVSEIEGLNIPANIHPNTKSFYFLFNADSHRLYWESSGRNGALSVGFLSLFFGKAFKEQNVLNVFGDVEFDVVSGHESVKYLLETPSLSKISIDIKLPNADDVPDDFEEDFMNRLKEQNARRYTSEIFSASGETLEPDGRTRALVNVATRNGNAKAVGKNVEGIRVERELQEHPLTKAKKYDPELHSEASALEWAAVEIDSEMQQVMNTDFSDTE